MAEYLMSEIQIPAIGDPVMIVKDKEARDDLSTALVITESSNPISFTTRTAQNAQSAEITLDPIQDLHGYDHPWPEGGGKNLLPMTVDSIKASNTTGGTWSGNTFTRLGVTWTIQTDDGGNVTGILVNGTAIADTNLYVANKAVLESLLNLVGTTVFCWGCPSGGTSSSYRMRFQRMFSDPTSGNMMDYGSGGAGVIKDFSEEEGAVYARIEVFANVTFDNLLFTPQIEIGSAKTTFEPYTNICPITGHTEVSVLGCGKNLLPMTVDSIKSSNKSGSWSGNAYTVSGVTFAIQTDNDGNVTGILANGTATENTAFALLSSSESVVFDVDTVLNGCPSGGSINTYALWNNNEGTVIDNGNGATIPINTATYGRIRIVNGYTATNLLFQPMIRLATDTDPTFEPYTPSNDLTTDLGMEVYGGTFDPVSGELVVTWGYIAEYAGETLPGEWISDRDVYAPNTSPSTGAEVVYELATPITYHLTPTQVKLLEGANTIWTDGTSIKVSYRDGKVATLADLQDTANNLQEQIDQNKTMEDETTQLLYKLGVNNGLLFIEEV